MFDFNEEEGRIIGTCECCGERIYDDNQEIYIDNNQNYFCCLDCALQAHGISLSEDYLG